MSRRVMLAGLAQVAPPCGIIVIIIVRLNALSGRDVHCRRAFWGFYLCARCEERESVEVQLSLGIVDVLVAAAAVVVVVVDVDVGLLFFPFLRKRSVDG